MSENNNKNGVRFYTNFLLGGIDDCSSKFENGSFVRERCSNNKAVGVVCGGSESGDNVTDVLFGLQDNGDAIWKTLPDESLVAPNDVAEKQQNLLKSALAKAMRDKIRFELDQRRHCKSKFGETGTLVRVDFSDWPELNDVSRRFATKLSDVDGVVVVGIDCGDSDTLVSFGKPVNNTFIMSDGWLKIASVHDVKGDDLSELRKMVKEEMCDVFVSGFSSAHVREFEQLRKQ